MATLNSYLFNSYFKYKWTKFFNLKTEWMTKKIKMTQVYVAYKRFTSSLRISRLEVKG